MKALLWSVLVCSLLFNVTTSHLWSGTTQTALSVASGLTFLGPAFTLWLLRDKNPRSS
ncbi:hypothetical protein [Streptomyces lichenis]|uniref:Uncharacterized protein n=1 Tax=Streptomyces lichenis TaxID=2306967 RepID=A0ABT0I3P6_9ACTN|nr:hypothetical protein [Streptomyces lichenis]MCK8675950.1 hypothetical protein [Streptomyces lichenis]